MQRISGCHHSDVRRYLDTRTVGNTVRRLSPSILIEMRLSMKHENPFAGQQGTVVQAASRMTVLASYNCTGRKPIRAWTKANAACKIRLTGPEELRANAPIRFATTR